MSDQVTAQKISLGQDLLPLIGQLETGGEDDPDNAVSHAGAVGRYQIMPGTARQYGFEPEELKDPERSKQAASTILNDLYKRYHGDVGAILVAYNAGPSVANKWLASNRTMPLPKETVGYLDRASAQATGGNLPGPEEVRAGAPPAEPGEPSTPRGKARMQQLMDAGFGPDEVLQWKADLTKRLLDGGFKPSEIDAYWGETPPDTTPIDDHVQANLAQTEPEKVQEIAKSPLDMVAAGWGMSVTGLQANMGLPKIQMPADATLGQKLLSSAGQMAGDLPATLGGAFAGGEAGAALGALGGPLAPLTIPAGAILGAGAGAMGLPAAMRELLMGFYRRGDIHTWDDFAKMAGASLNRVGRAGFVGALTSPAQLVAGPIAAKVGGEVLGPAVGSIASNEAQALAMTGVNAALDHKVPDADDFLVNSIMALPFTAYHVAKGRVEAHQEAKDVARHMQEIYAATGTPPWTQRAAAQTDPKAAQEILTEDVNGNSVAPSFLKATPDQPEPFQGAGELTIKGENKGPPGPPNEPPPEGEVIPPEPGPKKVEDQSIKPSVDDIGDIIQESIGEPVKGEKLFDFAKLWRGWVSELAPFRAIDNMLMRMGVYDRKTQIGMEDVFRQTYRSDSRAAYLITEGGLDPVTREKLDFPSLKDAATHVNEDGGNMRDWVSYMLAKRALKLAELGKEPGIKGTPEMWQQFVDAKDGTYSRGTDTWNRAMDGALEYGRRAGVFSDEQVAAMKRDNPMYISFRRLLDGPMAERRGFGRNFRTRAPVKLFEGDDRQIMDPVLASIDNVHQIVRMADRNIAIGNAIALAETRGMKPGDFGLKQLKYSPQATIAEPGSDLFKPYAVGDESAYEPFLAMRAQKRAGADAANNFLFFREGKAELWRAEDEALAQGMRGADRPGEMNPIVELAAKVAALKRTGITAPLDFPLKILAVKHPLTAYIFDPNHPAPFVAFFKGVMPVLTKNEVWDEFWRNGGLGTAMTEMDRDYIQTDMQRAFEESGTWDAMWNTVRHPLAAMHLITEKLDAIMRVGNYQMLKEQGLDDLKAATATNKAYIDYAERGTAQAAQTWAKMTPFFRPFLLGQKQQFEGWANDWQGVAKRALWSVTLPTAAFYALNYLQDTYGDLPEDQKFKNLPRWQKDTMFVLPSVGGVRVRVPMPFGAGLIFGGLTTRFLDHWADKDLPAFDNWARTFLQEYLPPLVPAVAVPPLERWANKSFYTGHALVPGSLEKVSGPLQYTENTTEPAKALAKVLNYIPGADATGLNSPIMVEEYVRTVTGATGYAMLRALDIPFKQTDKPWELADTPFLTSFLVRNPGMTAEPIEAFMERRIEIHQKHDDYRKLLKDRTMGQNISDGELEQAAEAKFPTQGVDQAEKSIQILHSVLQGVAYNKTMEKDEKRQFTDQVVGNMIQIARTTLHTLNQADEAMKQNGG